MKKIILFLLLILPISVSATANYDITDYYVKANILENGDLRVQELMVLDGEFNGYERDIVYTNDSLSFDNNEIDFANSYIYNADGIKDVSIKAKYVDTVSFETMNDFDFDLFNETIYASNGDLAKYTKTNIYGGERYRMYYHSNNDRVAFFITYTIENAVVIHNDVAELYWNFIGSDSEDDLRNVNIKVYLPEEDNSNNFRIWAHGNLTGEIKYLEENNSKVGLVAKINQVYAYEPVDIRTTFDKSLIKDSSMLDHSNVNALDKILDVETKRADEANNLRNELKTKYNGVVIATIIYYVLFLVVLIYTIKKYGIDNKTDFDHEYNREFINDYDVEVVDYLINKKNITPNAMSASIMNLIYKKKIKAEEIPGKSEKKKEYKFTLINEENFSDSEKYLVGFLFNKIGKTNDDIKTFTTIELKKYASSSVYCDNFINSYTAWKHKVIKDGKEQNFYEKTSKAIIFSLIALVIAILLVRISVLWGVDFILTYITPFVAFAFLIYTIVNTKKTVKGALHYAKWMAFKRFLIDFGNFKEKELPEISLWERYLVYATVFGIADKVEKTMNVKIKEFDLSNTSYTDIYIYHNLHLSNTITRVVNDSVQKSFQRQAANNAAVTSKSSSGGGFGGGFSSGGGFGGGGGGGRGF